MMKGRLSLCQLGIFIVCLFFVACIPENIELPYRVKSVTTDEVINVTPNEAKLNGIIKVADAYSVTCGMIYGTSPTLSSTSGTKKSIGAIDGVYSIAITGLNANTTYYYRAYAVDAGRYKYGEVRSFTTKKHVTVTTGEASEITYNSATLGGTINNSDKSLTCGIIYGTSSSLSSSSGAKKSTTSSGSFSVSLAGLSSNTTYYYRAYVIVDGEYKYGEIHSFKTLQAITVTTGEATDITMSGATLGGTVYGSNESLTCGVIYSTSSVLSSTSGTMISLKSNGNFSIKVSGLIANTIYYYCAYVVVDGEYEYGDILSFQTESEVSVTEGEAIDLGLSVKWASCNVGASVPEGYGGYYAWGETEEKTNYAPLTYKYYLGDLNGDGYYYDPNEYQNIGSNISGTSYDVAHVKWGGSWRMPTLDEIKELCNKCSWEWTSINGVNGQKVIGPNGNSIFLPAAGDRYGAGVINRGSYGYYCSGTLYEGDSSFAYALHFHSGGWGWIDDYRYLGHTVRPVTVK